MPGGEEPAVRLAQDGNVAVAAGAVGRDKEGFQVAEVVKLREFPVKAVGQSAHFLAGITPEPLYRDAVWFQLAQALGAIVEIERQGWQTGKDAGARHG